MPHRWQGTSAAAPVPWPNEASQLEQTPSPPTSKSSSILPQREHERMEFFLQKNARHFPHGNADGWKSPAEYKKAPSCFFRLGAQLQEDKLVCMGMQLADLQRNFRMERTICKYNARFANVSSATKWKHGDEGKIRVITGANGVKSAIRLLFWEKSRI